VIAVETRWAFERDFDMGNSLYGPAQFTFSMSRPGVIVAEGTTRDADKAFFTLDNADCVSAVAAITSVESDNNLQGRLYRPLEVPRHPLSPKLWVRLRDCLFGAGVRKLIDEMKRIPCISENEAETLVEHGVDDVSFFAEGLIELPEGIPMEESRFQELRNQATRLAMIWQTGQVAHLRAAQGVDLRPLSDEGIFTIDQLLQRKERPRKIDETLWHRLRDEATAIRASA